MEFFNTPFWQNFVSNALATFVGAYLSIRAGIYLLNREQAMQREKEKDIKIDREVTLLLAIERVLEKNQPLLEIIKTPLLNEPYELDEFPIDLTLLESTMSLKYDYIEDLDLVISIDEVIYTLQVVSRFYEQLYSVVYGNQDINNFGIHPRDEYIDICRQLLLSAISAAEKEIKSVIEEIEKYSSPPDGNTTTKDN